MSLWYPPTYTGIRQIYIGNITRSVGGSQSITGLGFKPKVVIFFQGNHDVATEVWSMGFDNGSSHRCKYKPGYTSTVYEATDRSIVCMVDYSNFIRGYVSSMDSDGFTITWDITGSATAYVIYLAIA